MKAALTLQQRKVYDFLLSYRAQNGVPPSRGDICEHFGWVSLNAAQSHLIALEKKGWIERLSGKRSRGLVYKQGGYRKKLIREATMTLNGPTHQYE